MTSIVPAPRTVRYCPKFRPRPQDVRGYEHFLKHFTAIEARRNKVIDDLLNEVDRLRTVVEDLLDSVDVSGARNDPEEALATVLTTLASKRLITNSTTAT
jgi:hypothetical protein